MRESGKTIKKSKESKSQELEYIMELILIQKDQVKENFIGIQAISMSEIGGKEKNMESVFGSIPKEKVIMETGSMENLKEVELLQ